MDELFNLGKKSLCNLGPSLTSGPGQTWLMVRSEMQSLEKFPELKMLPLVA